MKITCNCVKAAVLMVAALCLALATGASAQTSFTQNDIYTIAGGGTVPSNPSNLDLPGPAGAIKDSVGNIYIASQDSAYVYKLSTSNVLSVFAGLGYSGFNKDNIQASKALVGGVTGFATDGKGNIYFADAVGSRIRKVATTGIITTVAGNGTKCDKAGVCGDGGLATSANLNLPESVAIYNGVIYIADMTDDRIRAVNTGTSAVTVFGITIQPNDIQTVAGNSQPCGQATSACGDGGPATSANLTLPQGVTVDGKGNLYIADTGDQKIREVAAGQNTITTFAGDGLPCTNPASHCGDGLAPTSARLWLPQGVYADAAGDVWIADTQSNRIRYIQNVASPTITTVVNQAGTQGFSGDGGPATSAQIDLPGGIFADSNGNLLVSDTGNQRIRQVTQSTGNIATIVGGGLGGDGALATSATLAVPWGVAEDANGNLYVADTGNNRIRMISPTWNSTGGMITTVAGTGSAGYTGDGAAATSATLNAPTAVAMDSNGNLYIVDSNNFVVREVNMSTGVISTVFGNGQSCTSPTSACGDGGPGTSASFVFPLMLALDSTNNLYVTDYQGYKIRMLNVATNKVSTVAGVGLQGYKGNGGPATSARINHPAGIGIDPKGNIIFADQWNDIVRYVNTSGIINIYCLNTLAKFHGDGGPCPNASMFNPLALTVSPAGNAYISGGNDNVVQQASSTTNIFSNVAGSPNLPYLGGFSGDGGPATSARMENLGAFVDGSNNLFIADGGTNRIRYVPLAPAVTFPTNTMKLGEWPIGTKGTAVPLAVNSTGGLDLSLTNITITGTNSGDFAQTNNCGTLPATMSPQVSCSAQVTLTPSVYGPETATLNFFTNETGSPQTVTLTGSGPNFALSASNVTVTAGQSGPSTVTATPQARFNQAVTLSCTSGLPSGATCTSFVPNPLQLYGAKAQTSTLTIQTSSTTPKGNYTVTISGTYNTLQNTATLTLTVQ